MNMGIFKVEQNSQEMNRLEVEIEGLGHVTINRTLEGLIIDVLGNDEVVDTLALENEDFVSEKEAYTNSLKTWIMKYDRTSEGLDEFVCEAYNNRMNERNAFMAWFDTHPFDITDLTGLKGELEYFAVEVRKLERPYIPITYEANTALQAGAHDYYRTPGGAVVTYGAADGGFSLMPLNDEAAQKVLNNQ